MTWSAGQSFQRSGLLLHGCSQGCKYVGSATKESRLLPSEGELKDPYQAREAGHWDWLP